ncbi:MAG: molybdopterin dinucleotide binding domain-containing protein, partial [Verrucomicrobiota bacterium]|nr:molybdopterin dinucleotide binding domain-containing protein [Verrucomicrobiota bacterium]
KNGLMPIRGHSSVQGGAEMGAYSTAFPGGVPVNAANAKRLAKQYGFDIPNWPGMQTTGMIDAAHAGELDLFYCLGGNFLRNLPEPGYVAEALANVPLRVHQDIVLTDQMFVEPGEDGVLLLPAKTRYEQDDGGVETTTERRVAFSPEIPRQVGEAKAEWKILLEMAKAARPGQADKLGCEDGWKVREEIARVVPFYDGVQHLRETHDAFQYGGPHLCADGSFATADGQAHFIPVKLPPLRLEKGKFFASTRRGKQFNSLIYGERDPINGADRDSVLMSGDDAGELGLANGDRVLLKNDLGQFDGRVLIAPIATGNLQIHWPEGNVIIRRGRVDARGGVPDYNAWVSIEKA